MGRRAVKVLAAVLLLASGAIVNPSSTAACTCVGIGPEQARRFGDVVFHGRAILVQESPGLGRSDRDRTHVLFHADTVWKGSVQSMYVVEGGSDTASCDKPFKRGRRYVVAADRGRSEVLETNMCMVWSGDTDALGPGTGTFGFMPIVRGVASAPLVVFPLSLVRMGLVAVVVSLIVTRIVTARRRRNAATMASQEPPPSTSSIDAS